MDEIWPLIADERRGIADMLEGLTDEQWNTPSLCGEWTVRDVAGHLTAGFNLSWKKFAVGMIKHRSFDRYNAVAARELSSRATEEIVADLRDNAEHHFTPPGVGNIAPLVDVVTHGGDIRRPLAMSTTTPTTTFRYVLDQLANPSRKLQLPLSDTSGLQLRATDQDWSSGSGALVQGTSEALAMGLGGRPSALDDLTGDGVAEIRRRLK
jgi:uncharacterized protein (TIGR03083 family)